MPRGENQKRSREKHGLDLYSCGIVVPNPVFFTYFLILGSDCVLKNTDFTGVGLGGRVERPDISCTSQKETSGADRSNIPLINTTDDTGDGTMQSW